jgi:hypothetical protein
MVTGMRDDQIDTLRKLLRDLFTARYKGVDYSRAARAHGYVDGYMAALMRSKVLTQREVLSIVAEERARVAGPAIGAVAGVPALEGVTATA